MSDIGSKPSHSDAALATALRGLARSAPQDAPPEVGEGLRRAFHRHHTRRKIVRTTALLAFVFMFAVFLWFMTGPSPRRALVQSKTRQSLVIAGGAASPPVTAERMNSVGSPESSAIGPRPPATSEVTTALIRRRVSRNARPARAATTMAAKDRFVALPSFAFHVPGEELRVIRVNMPVSSFRLLGVQVDGEIPSRRITTDLVIGTDGTPYAFRPIT
ncbi:MAG TPA: hypothetical protein VG498_04120 [Terriglobales bacterium]|nr:hypothetical protein [Terriglobales bacterium]